MFKSDKKLAGNDTTIGHGTLAEGSIISESDVRIEGEYRGDIECKGDIVLGECGIARSNLKGRDIVISGQVFGDVMASGRLTITASGQVYGSVNAQSLLIQEGGVFNGSCQMERRPETARARTLTGGDAAAAASKEAPAEKTDKAQRKVQAG